MIEDFENKKVRNPTRQTKLALSEIMTIVLCFHKSGYWTFKHYYQCLVRRFWCGHFPRLVSYSRFVNLIKRVLFPMFCFLESILGVCTGITFVDSTLLTVCHIKRASSHKVFKNLAKKGKVTTGWFFGFKLHIAINEKGEIIGYRLTAGNVSDVAMLEKITKKCHGKVFGDKGYLSKKVFKKLLAKNIKLITKIRKNMKNKLMEQIDKLLLKKRGLIESVNNRLKNGCQIEHHRHRSRANFVVNLLSGLAAYQLGEKKPTMRLKPREKSMFLAA